MSTESAGGPYLIELLRRYFAEVLRQKQEIELRMAAEQKAQDHGEVVELLTEDEITSRAEATQRDLKGMLEEQAQDVLRRGDEREQRRFREMQYVMVAFTDEVMLSLNWDGQDFWRDHLLEEQIFASHHSGTQFFRNIEELLRQRDPTRADVGSAYLLALSLGFRGRCVGVSGEAEIERYRQQLFAFLFQRNPGFADDQKLYPQPYAHTLTGKPHSWLPVLRPWLFTALAVLGLYVCFGHVLWARQSTRIVHAIDDLREAQRTSPSANSGSRF